MYVYKKHTYAIVTYLQLKLVLCLYVMNLLLLLDYSMIKNRPHQLLWLIKQTKIKQTEKDKRR